MPVSAVRFSAVGGPLALALAGEPSLAGDFSLTGKPSLAGEFSLVGGFSLGSWWGCSVPITSQQADISKDKYPCTPRSGKQIIHLRWGLPWRKVAGSGKVVSSAPPAVAVGSSSMTITGTLALFAALWARVLKRNKFRVKQMRCKKNSKN